MSVAQGNIGQQVTPKVTIKPGSYNAATVTGLTIDTQDKRTILFDMTINTISGGSIDVKIQESSDDSAWTDISAGTYTGQTLSAYPNKTAAANNILLALDLPGKRLRYLRAFATLNGSNTVQFGVNAIMDAGRTLPVSGSPAP